MRFAARILLVAGVVACTHARPQAPAVPGGEGPPVNEGPRIKLDTLSGPIYVVSKLDGPITALISPPPDYPTALRAAGVQGRVLLQVVIDTLGLPEPATI